MLIYRKSLIARRKKTFFPRERLSIFVSFFILFPLLSPKGVETLFPVYKKLMALLSLIAMIFIVIDLLSCADLGKRVVKRSGNLAFYFIAAFLVSVFSEAGMKNGLQELFFYPLVFLYILNLDEDAVGRFMVNAAVLLLINLCLNFLISPVLFSGSLHMTFLGHVQIFSQYGLLCIYVAGSLARRKLTSPFLYVGLLLMAALSMLVVDADSARYSLVVLVAVLFVGHHLPLFFKIDFRFFVLAFIVVGFAVVFLTIARISPLAGTSVDWTFSGRLFVWESCINLFCAAPIFGYGIENPAITVFWNPNATSYAHSQILQCMIDGGVFLLIAMVLMLCSVAYKINGIENQKQKSLAISAFVASLFFMIFDSFTPYCYIYILFALIVKESAGRERGCLVEI